MFHANCRYSNSPRIDHFNFAARSSSHLGHHNAHQDRPLNGPPESGGDHIMSQNTSTDSYMFSYWWLQWHINSGHLAYYKHGSCGDHPSTHVQWCSTDKLCKGAHWPANKTNHKCFVAPTIIHNKNIHFISIESAQPYQLPPHYCTLHLWCPIT